MKKILIFGVLAFVGMLPAFATCKINSLGICTNQMQATTGFENKNIQDKMIPSRMNNLRTPNSAQDNRNLQGQQRTPSQINRDLIQQKTNQPYDANCQFGNCINRTNSNGNNNNF